MDVSKKIYLIRMAEKIERNRKYADKIGTKIKAESKSDNSDNNVKKV